ncbi:hypothetical protein DIPPA_05094 [Diplonema papillatum]|nr:hypothetical protein DIPPA_05094 [Diplonema papillatum]
MGCCHATGASPLACEAHRAQDSFATIAAAYGGEATDLVVLCPDGEPIYTWHRPQKRKKGGGGAGGRPAPPSLRLLKKYAALVAPAKAEGEEFAALGVVKSDEAVLLLFRANGSVVAGSVAFPGQPENAEGVDADVLPTGVRDLVLDLVVAVADDAKLG